MHRRISQTRASQRLMPVVVSTRLAPSHASYHSPEYISHVLHLHLRWLPVQRSVDFKLATLMFKSLHGCAPSYLSDACKSALDASRRLHSTGAITCVIPLSRTRLGNRSFDVAGLQLWNKLPASLQSSDSLCQFRRQLKTFLFVED